ncbi:MAG: SRPBCC family protein [Acidimicrobiales bacterium]
MDTITDPTAESSIVIGAPPSALWTMVADVTRIPQWSPVCHQVEWIDGSHEAVVGARFRGHNRLNGARWARECVITEADAGEVLAFSALFKGEESTRWRYRFEPEGEGTRVTEAYQVVLIPPWLRLLRRLPGMVAKSERDTRWNVATSLERLKALAEADGNIATI